MSPESSPVVSRRQWLAQASLPAVAAAVALPASVLQAAPPAQSGASAENASLGTRVYDVRQFGAKGDGTTLDTAAIQAAIDACTKDNGGTVLVPAGDFVCGTIELKSNVTLHLATKGRLLGSPRMEDYKAGNRIPPGNGNIVFVSAANAENITIEGRGTIDGNGAKFFTGKGDNTGPGQNQEAGYFGRPHLLIFFQCKNLVVRDTFLTASAYHGIRILECQHIRFDGVRIHNRVNKNNDGFHFRACSYVHIANCDVTCQDDACALFGGNKFVTVTNSTFSTRWSIFRIGGGETENITVSNCVIYETYGCPIKMHFGRTSKAQNITFSNIIMKDVTGPITVGFNGAPRRRNAPAADAPASPPAEQPPIGFVRNIAFNGIRATVVARVGQHADMPFPNGDGFPGEQRMCIVVNGAAGAVIENVSFNDVHATFEGGGTAEEGARRDVPQIAGEYFEIGTPPSFGIFARGVRGLSLNNVRLEVQKPDARPAVVFDHVEDATATALSLKPNGDAESLIRMIDSRDILITSPRVLAPAKVFLRLEGGKNASIVVEGGDLSRAQDSAAFASGAVETALRIKS